MTSSTRTYRYVGPARLLELAHNDIARCEPDDVVHLRSWLSEERIPLPGSLTFIVTERGRLRVAHRHAEHVACARAQPVLGAGELELGVAAGRLHVISVTNQSTGYCPEPSCFPQVAAALSAIGLAAPVGFAHDFIFRRCTACDVVVIVKDHDFVCPGCDATLPESWNFDAP